MSASVNISSEPALPENYSADLAMADDLNQAEPSYLGSADYRWTHRKQLIDIFCGGHKLPPDKSAPAENWGPTLGSRRPQEQAQLGGILQPTSRRLGLDLPGLALAVELALSHQCFLMVICSRQARTIDFPEVYREKLGDMLILIELSDVHPDWLPVLASSANPISKLKRSNDVGSKRNVGIGVAIALGWHYLLMIDDDISTAESGPTLNSRYLSHALSLMQDDESLKAIGWTLEDYNDNSVVGHARPFVDMPQGIFIGGGALLVRCDSKTPFFPDIYNEDWLFLISLAVDASDCNSALGWGGRVHQQPYMPFQARRAQSEEAGEIIGECLLNLLEDHGSRYERVMTPSHWRRAIQSRWRLLQTIKETATMKAESSFETAGPRARQCLIDAMSAAQAVHRELKPMDLLRFVRTWRNDEKAAWCQHLSKLRTHSDRVPVSGVRSLALEVSPFSRTSEDQDFQRRRESRPQIAESSRDLELSIS